MKSYLEFEKETSDNTACHERGKEIISNVIVTVWYIYTTLFHCGPGAADYGSDHQRPTNVHKNRINHVLCMLLRINTSTILFCGHL